MGDFLNQLFDGGPRVMDRGEVEVRRQKYAEEIDHLRKYRSLPVPEGTPPGITAYEDQITKFLSPQFASVHLIRLGEPIDDSALVAALIDILESRVAACDRRLRESE